MYSAVVETFFKILKNRLFKYMISVSKNMYIDKLNNNESPKFRVGDNVRISKNKTILPEGYVPNWPEEIFVITKVKNNVP